MTTISSSFLKQRDYWVVGLTHFSVDALTSGRNLVMALLAITLGLTNTHLAIATILYNVGNALSQPFFGLLTDKIGPRWPVVGGVGWMVLFGGIAALGDDQTALISITIMGLGSGAFHPAGTLIASQVNSYQRAQATALFFLMGQMGLFAGPILAGLLMAPWGRVGYGWVVVLAVFGFWCSWQWVVNRPYTTPVKVSATSQATAPKRRETPSYLIMLGVIVISYSTVSITMMTFVPKLLADQAYHLAYVGWLAGGYMIGSAFGGVAGGALADRFNNRWVIVLSMLTAVPLLYLAIPAQGTVQLILLIVAGFAGGMPHSILVLMVQGLLPNRKALASGLVLGIMFFGGSIGSSVIGLLADQIGLALALQWMCVLPLTAAVTMYLLPKR